MFYLPEKPQTEEVFMDENESVGRFLASLLAEYDMGVDKFCRRSGLQ